MKKKARREPFCPTTPASCATMGVPSLPPTAILDGLPRSRHFILTMTSIRLADSRGRASCRLLSVASAEALSSFCSCLAARPVPCRCPPSLALLTFFSVVLAANTSTSLHVPHATFMASSSATFMLIRIAIIFHDRFSLSLAVCLHLGDPYRWCCRDCGALGVGGEEAEPGGLRAREREPGALCRVRRRSVRTRRRLRSGLRRSSRRRTRRHDLPLAPASDGGAGPFHA